MKLLLDEMLSASIAEQLRMRGHDVAAVAERTELRGRPDPVVLDAAQVEERVLVTYDPGDFLDLDRQYRHRGRDHHGIVILHPRRFPQGPMLVGMLVTSLEKFLTAPSPYPSFIHWLR